VNKDWDTINKQWTNNITYIYIGCDYYLIAMDVCVCVLVPVHIFVTYWSYDWWLEKVYYNV